MSNPLCIAYVRFSSVTQSEGASLERQVEKCVNYAKAHSLILDETNVYRDLGKSAFTGDHVSTGELGEILSKINQGTFPQGTTLLVESLDRLSRQSPIDAFTQFQVILNAGIIVVTLCNNTIYTKQSLNGDFSQLLVSLSEMYRANEESEMKSSRIRNGFNKVRANLSKEKQTANCPQWLKLSNDRKFFAIQEERAGIIKRIFTLSYDGVGIKTIVRILNQEKIPAFRSSAGWGPSCVRKILSSRAVLGEFQPHTSNPVTKKYDPVGEPVVGYFPKIIDDDMFNAVQARLSNGTHRAGRTAKVENLFGGITKCGNCGARMDVVTKGKFPNYIRNLVCDSARKGLTKCGHTGLKCTEIENEFMRYCREKDILELLDCETQVEEAKSLRLSQQMSSQEGELISVERKIHIYVEELEESEDKLERDHVKVRIRELLHRKEKINIEISSIKLEIDNINQSIEKSETKINGILHLYKTAANSLNEADVVLFRTRLRNQLRQIVKKVLVYPKGRVYSDYDIEKVMHQYSLESDGLSAEALAALNAIRDIEIQNMKISQNNTTANRYFSVYFKNNNYRDIKYSHESNSYYVSANRAGDMLEWTMGGKPMKPIDGGAEKRLIDAEILHYKHNNPELSDDDIESYRLYLESGDVDDASWDRVSEARGTAPISIRLKSSPFPSGGSTT